MSNEIMKQLLANYFAIKTLKKLNLKQKSLIPGASPGFGRGGAKNFFFRFGNLHVAKRHAAHGEAMRFARGVRGHAPPRKFFKMVQFDAFWCIF